MKKGAKFQHKRPDEPQVCAICGTSLKTYNALGKHVAKYHGDKCDMKAYVDKYVEPYAHKCPYCDNERNFVHGRYKETCKDKACVQKHREATNLVRFGDKCSLKGSNEQKVVDAIVEKYGVDNVFKLDSMQKLARTRTKEKYGHEYAAQVPEIRKKVEDTCMVKFGHKTNLLNPDQIAQIKQTCVAKYGHEYVCASEYTKQRTIEHNMAHYGVPWFMQTQMFKDKTAVTCEQRYGVANPGLIPDIVAKRRHTNIERYGVPDVLSSHAVRTRCREVVRAKYGVDYIMQNPDMWKRITSGVRKNGFMSLVEAKFAKWCDAAGITYKYDEWINGKHWDFTIYNQNQLDFIVEIDGEWCHGLVGDSDGKHQAREKKNIDRLTRIPSNVKYLCTDSNNIKDAFTYVTAYIGCEYNDWVAQVYSTLPVEFPYPCYRDERLRYDFRRLCNTPSYNGSDLGMCAIYHFNKSLYGYSVDSMVSPLVAWNDRQLLRECLNMRELYNSIYSSINMTSYLYLSKTARLHSITSPGMVKRLMSKYLIEAKVVVDPYAYTGNIMLSCASLNKTYIGCGINDQVVDEMVSMAKHYNLDATILDTTRSLADKYDALFTCMPVGAPTDMYITWCVQNVTCNTYVFIVHDTVQYAQYIADHDEKYGDNSYVVVIQSCNE